MPIERDLHDLLYAHDCVIVPRFGGFLTHYRPARLDEQRRSIHPPSKDVSFNRHLTRTDGLLTDHVAKGEGINFNQAGAVIDGEVDAWQSKLNRDGRLELPRIGTFYRDAEHNLQFDPDRRVNFLKNAYGLRPVAAVPRVMPAPTPVPAAPLPLKKVIVPQEEDEGQRSFPWLAAAAVVALLSTAATWWVVSSKGPVGAQWSGFDLFATAEPGLYSPRSSLTAPALEPLDTAAWTLPAELTGVRELPIPGEETVTLTVDLGAPAVEVAVPAPAPEKQVAVAETTAVVVPQVRTRYHIIGGCFLQKENADGFKADLQAKGFAAAIIDRKGGLYRVAIGSYPKRELALEALAAVRKEEAPQAWLLVR